jgi:predicted SAM-dependent methyltransferase
MSSNVSCVGRIKHRLFGRPDKNTREQLANIFLRGQGIEIGALHQPLTVPSVARVTYIDRFSVGDLRAHYPEFNKLPLVEPDIVDDGEKLSQIADASQDFVIANHFLEHCEDPIGELKNFLRVMKPEGVLYMAMPNMMRTFDCDRAPTPLQHLIDDHENGPSATRDSAYDEWVRKVNKVEDEAEAQRQKKHLMETNYSIHFHAWRQTEMLELLLALHRRYELPFDIEVIRSQGIEVIIILRKHAVTE